MKNQLVIDSNTENQVKNYLQECTNDNKLTEQDYNVLSRLLKKVLTPSKELLMAVSEEEINTADKFLNLSDSYLFLNSKQTSIGQRFTNVSLAIGKMYSDYLIENNAREITEESFNNFLTNAGLPPNIQHKPLVLMHLLITFLDDPLEILLNYGNLIDKLNAITFESIFSITRSLLHESVQNQTSN